MATEKDVLAALGTVMDPELNVSLVQAGMVKGVRVDGGRIFATIELTTPACPLKAKIQADTEAALKALPGVKGLELSWTAQVRGQQQAAGMLPGVKNIILVGAGKGGVGKSTVAVNLAVALAKHGASVGLLDADFYGPSIPMMTGLSDQRPVSPDGKRLEPLEALGIKVMSLGFLVEPDQALIWRGPMLHGALQQLMRDVNWGALDYLVMDLPPGTGDVALTVSQSIRAAGAVLVTTPQDVALADVVRAKHMFDKVQIPVLGIVENMSQFVCPHCGKSTPIFHHGGGRRAAELFGVPFLGEIPLELAVRVGGDEGRPIVASAPDSAEAQAFLAVARAVAGRVSVANGARAPAAAVPATSYPRAMAHAPSDEDELDVDAPEAPGEAVRGSIVEAMRKVAFAGLGALFMTEEGIRSLAGQLKLPKEALGFVLSQAERTKDEVGRVLSDELRRFLRSDKLREDVLQLLSGMRMEVTASVRLVPDPDRKPGEPPTRPRVEVTNVRTRSARKKPD